MSEDRFVVRLPDLERGPREEQWVLDEAWLEQALADSDATPAAAGAARVTLSLNGRQVVVRGRLAVDVTMPCAVTLDPVPVHVEPELLLLLDPPAGPPPGLRRGGKASVGKASGGREAGSGGAEAGAPGPSRTRQRAPRGHDDSSDWRGWASDPELGDELAARDSHDGERVVLDSYFREFILLDLPMTVRRGDLPDDGTLPESVRAAIAAASPSSTGPVVDPRLAPLAALAERLKDEKE